MQHIILYLPNCVKMHCSSKSVCPIALSTYSVGHHACLLSRSLQGTWPSQYLTQMCLHYCLQAHPTPQAPRWWSLWQITQAKQKQDSLSDFVICRVSNHRTMKTFSAAAVSRAKQLSSFNSKKLTVSSAFITASQILLLDWLMQTFECITQ